MHNSFDTQFSEVSQENRHSIYIQKLSQLIREHTVAIESNQPIIEQLQCQRKFFKKICDKQKKKLNSIDIHLLRSEYEKQVELLHQDKNKLYTMLNQIHEQAEENHIHFQTEFKALASTKAFMLESLQSIDAENTQFQNILFDKIQTTRMEEKRVQDNQSLLAEKEEIEEKYRLILHKLNK